MTWRKTVIASTAFLSLAAIVAAVYGQKAATKRSGQAGSAVRNNRRMVQSNQPIPKSVNPRAVAKSGPTMHTADMLVSTWTLSVDWGLNLDADTQALYQHMTNILNNYSGVPNDRLNYYSAVNGPPDSIIHGWNGLVTNVQQADGGVYVVTITVDPLLSTTVYGGYTAVWSDYAEMYAIDINNNVTYLGFLDPQGLAGQVPAMGTAG